MVEELKVEKVKEFPEEAKKIIEMLSNLVEELSGKNRELAEEVQKLRDELNRMKGEQGKPDIKASKKDDDGDEGNEEGAGNEDISSEEERSTPKKRRKKKKNAEIVIHQEEKLTIETNELPEDVEFKGYEPVVVQDITIGPNNTRFLKAKYYSPSEGKSYLAPMPAGYEGEFGPAVRTMIITLYHASGMTEPKIQEFLGNFDISISEGQISNILTKDLEEWHEEKEAIVKAGLGSTSYQQTDDTGTRVNGKNQYCHIFCNPYYTAYFTRPYKNRLTVIHLMQGTEELQLKITDETLTFLEQFKVPKWAQTHIQAWIREDLYTLEEMEPLMLNELRTLGEQHKAHIFEAAALTAYNAQTDMPVIEILLSDDAPQFGRITTHHALCWVHEGRLYKKLIPFLEHHRQLLNSFLDEFWRFYKRLLEYCLNPNPPDAQQLRDDFDSLFSQTTGYRQLDKCIARTKAKKDKLLLALDFPDIPLHNNAAELGARQRVRKRKISCGPRTQDGLQAWDTFATLAETAKKLGVSFFAYVFDRVSRSYQLPNLADLIPQSIPLPAPII